MNMKSLLISAGVLALSGVVAAQQPLFVPTPDPQPATVLPDLVPPGSPTFQYQPQPIPAPQYSQVPGLAPTPDPVHGMPVPYEQVFVQVGPALPLYTNVRVRQPRNIHPAAVTKLVAIKEPCFGGSCVYIEVCVPPCGREEVCCFRRGDKMRLDYGKYSVDISTNRRGQVVVDYND
jgi:hypothetical protein